MLVVLETEFNGRACGVEKGKIIPTIIDVCRADATCYRLALTLVAFPEPEGQSYSEKRSHRQAWHSSKWIEIGARSELEVETMEGDVYIVEPGIMRVVRPNSEESIPKAEPPVSAEPIEDRKMEFTRYRALKQEAALVMIVAPLSIQITKVKLAEQDEIGDKSIVKCHATAERAPKVRIPLSFAEVPVATVCPYGTDDTWTDSVFPDAASRNIKPTSTGLCPARSQ